jgi:hypothetical protein
MTTVTWVVDTDGRHEISSPEHLIQLMHKGEKYTNAGSAPTDYIGAATSYIQTVDIDLANFHADITPIGGEDYVRATYDGGGHSVANWELHDGSSRRTNSAMFGKFDTNGTVKHLRLTGVWKNTGEANNKAFLVGFMNKETCSVYDIKTDFERGTLIDGAYNACVGVLVGFSQGKISACVVEGFIKVQGRANNIGGITGTLDRNGSLTYCANYGNFVGGLGTHNTEPTVRNVCTGGIVGRCHSGFRNMHNVINGMVGDIAGGYAGGILGRYRYSSVLPERSDTWLNCMVGDIIGTYQFGCIGGMISTLGQSGSGQLMTLTKMVNYMSGSIRGAGPWVMRDPGGGIVGEVENDNSATFNLSNSIVAMSGFVSSTAIDKLDDESNPVNASVTVNTDFGLTFDTNVHATTDPLTDFVTDDVFTLLPYLDMSGTDEFGNIVEFNPTFANLSGLDAASPYAQYSTLTIHTSPVISFPAKTTFGYDETNTTKYLTYSKKGGVTIDLYVDDGVQVQTSAADAVFTQSGTLLSGVDWAQDEFGAYEISSQKHLIQLMTKGTVFADTGSFPSDYRAGSYVQTADIDLGGYESAITPIGQKDDPFVGDYVGGGYSVLDWGYERGIVEDGTDVRVGLFGEIQGDISQLKLRGVWSLGPSNCSQAGFLVGQVNGSTSKIFDIDADFDEGTIMQPSTGAQSTCGVLIGKTEGTSTGIRLSGDVTYEGKSTILGGVVGEMSTGASISWIQNQAAFNKTNAGLGADNSVSAATADVLVGGIVGSIGPGADSAFHLFNAMVGDIQGEFCGGIVGRCSADAMTRSDTWVNSMQGSMTGMAGSTTGCSGGIIGDFTATGAQTPVITKVANYMRGDITTTISGGIIGRTTDTSGGAAPAVQCNNSVVAMDGTVTDTAIGQANHSVALSISVNADFGLGFSSNSYASEDALMGYETHPDFPLPYLGMKGGELGVLNDFEIIFVNLGGVIETSPFYGRDWLIIHNSPTLTFPYRTEFDFPDTNSTVYLTYGLLSSSTIFIDPSLSVLSSEALHVLDHSASLVAGTYPPLTMNVVISKSDANKQYHSITAYTKEKAIAGRPDTWFGSATRVPVSVAPRTLSDSYLGPGVSARGMHYNPATDSVYYVNGSNGKFQSFGMQSTSTQVVVSTDGTYHTLKGDFSNTYIFGSKTSAGGVQQVFRTDADGTNEVVVDTSTLFGGNAYGTSGFAVDRDNQKVYFHDTTNYIVRSLSWDLTGLVTLQTLTGDFKLYWDHSGSLCYARGFLYFGGYDPQTNKVDNKFYRYNLEDGGTTELLGVSGNMRNGGQGPTNDLYIDPFHNLMIISGNNTWSVEGVDFEFYKPYCWVTTQHFDGYDVTWEPVEGATSYQVVVNNIVVATTTDLAFTTRGHADGTLLNIFIKYSTDDVTFTNAPYGYTTAPVRYKFSEIVSEPNYERPTEGSATWLDPYDPSDVIYAKSGGINIYNFKTDAKTSYPNYGMHMFRRSFATQDIIGLANNRLINLGPGAEHVVQATVPPEFYTHPQSIQHFHCSYSGLIYFTVKTSNEVWSMNNDGTDAQLLFTLNGTATSLATDPHDPTTLVYGDGNDLMHRNLSTGVSRVVFAGAKMSNNNGIVVLDGEIFTTYRWQTTGYLRVNVDGVTGLDQGTRSWGTGTLVDTVNQRVYSLSFTEYTVYVDGNRTITSLPPDPSLTKFSAMLGPVSLQMSWPEVSDATKYQVGFSVGSPGANSITKRADILLADERRYTIPNLEPATTYSLYLYYSTDTSDPSELFGSETFVTLDDTPTNYTAASFVDDSGVVDLRKLKPETRGRMVEVMNDILTTGTKIQLADRGRGVRAMKKAKFVKTGEDVDVELDVPIAFSFTETAGAGQSATLNLSDNSTVVVSFDETTSAVTVGDVTYVDGDVLVLDGQKVTVLDA